ncbi:hypothetical protein EON67_12230 [archaeon]|nr:MAG: hypothetical protein EON67_12230 [archaeon]
MQYSGNAGVSGGFRSPPPAAAAAHVRGGVPASVSSPSKRFSGSPTTNHGASTMPGASPVAAGASFRRGVGTVIRPGSSGGSSSSSPAPPPSSTNEKGGQQAGPDQDGAQAEDASQPVLGAKTRALRVTFRETDVLSEKGLWRLYSQMAQLPLRRTPGSEVRDYAHTRSCDACAHARPACYVCARVCVWVCVSMACRQVT